MNLLILNELFGFAALFFSVLAFQKKDRKSILILQSISLFLFFIHFWFLAAYSGALMNLIGVFRNLVFERKNKSKWAESIYWLYFFICISLLCLLYFWQGFISLLPVVGLIFGTIGVWKNNPKEVRFFMFLTVFAWLAYSILVHSFSGVVTQIVIGSSLLIGIFRFDKKTNLR